MADTGSGGANKIELESQILCSALRGSWAGSLDDDDDLEQLDKHKEGIFVAARELYQLFPDLLPPPKGNMPPVSLYEMLDLRCDVPQSIVVASYFRAVKNFLRTENVKEKRMEYSKLLNAGFILRKPRLRLSHDLIVGRQWLIDHKVIPDDGTLEHIEEHVVAREAEPQFVRTQPMQDTVKLPMKIELLKHAKFIGPAEVQALKNQMSIAPEIPLDELILSAGYVTEQEMKSIQLGEYLLSQGKINIHQFAVAMYDERTQNVRMAESLQARGWLSY